MICGFCGISLNGAIGFLCLAERMSKRDWAQCFSSLLDTMTMRTENLWYRLNKDDPVFILKRNYSNIRHRCYNLNDINYKSYGGRGITMCVEWLNSRESFISWSLGAGFNSGLDIYRIDNDGPYSPDNCVWLTPQEHNIIHNPA